MIKDSVFGKEALEDIKWMLLMAPLDDGEVTELTNLIIEFRGKLEERFGKVHTPLYRSKWLERPRDYGKRACPD